MTHSCASTRRTLLKLATAAVAATAGAPLGRLARAADKFPSRPLKIVVPLPAGGVADAVVRVQAQQLEKLLKQTVIVDNRPGGSFVLGMNAMAAAPADGYTLLAINNSMLAAQVTLNKLNLLKSLVPISRSADTQAVLLASNKSGFKTVAELLAHAKANPGQLSYGVGGGAGVVEHLVTVAIEHAAGFKSAMIPFKGSVDGITALVQGEIQFEMVPLPLAMQFIPKGLVRPLAVFSAKRLKELPDVPTLAEAGVAINPFTYWSGFAVSAGTPPELVQELHHAIAEVNANPEVQAKLQAIGASAASSESPAAFTKEIAAELERMAAAMKAGNIKIEQ